MNRLFAMMPGILLLLALCACGAKNTQTVILVPDADGHVGKAEVVTTEGKQRLETANAMTTVSRQSTAPSAVTTASSGFINKKFAQVLAVEPVPAEKFIIYFKNNTSKIASGSQPTIYKILDAIKSRKAVSIKISGHTDSTGSESFNTQLSLSRASSIRNLLIEYGVAAGLLEVSSHGKMNQLVPTADNVAEPRNRRVEVIIR